MKPESGSEVAEPTSQRAPEGNLSSSPRTIVNHALLSSLPHLEPDNTSSTNNAKASQLLDLLQSPSPAAAYTFTSTEDMVLPPHLKKEQERRAEAKQVVAIQPVMVISDATKSGDIRARLERDSGVKVSDSQPGKAKLVTYAPSTDDGSQNMRRKQASPPPAMPANRGHGRGRGGKPGNNARWPTAAEQRADPNRWVTSWSSPSKRGGRAVSDVSSDWADAGGEGQRMRRGQVGDGSGYELADFHGGWAPVSLH